MNLPHLQTQAKPAAIQPAALGRKSINVLTSPRNIRRRLTNPETELIEKTLNNMLYPPDPTNSWKTLQTQRKNLLNLPYQNLANISLDLSQQVNKGLHDFLRFANPAHIIRPNSRQAEAGVNAFIAKLDRLHGSFKSLIDSAWAGIFTGGAIYMELTLDETGRMPTDIIVNNPHNARFFQYNDPNRGQVWRLGRVSRDTREVTYLDDNPRIKYLGFDRLADNPYGRPLMGPAVYASMILLTIIDILQKSLANQATSRTDYELDAEELLKIIDRNPDLAGDDEATAQFIEDQINKIENVVENLEPDSSYIHLSTVKVNYATTPLQTNTRGLDMIIQNLQRDVVNGYKGISALSNILDSTTETHIRSQLDYLVAILTSMQDEVADVITNFLNIGNQVQGIRSMIEFIFKRQRSIDRQAEAELEKTRTEIVIAKYEALLISREQAEAELAAIQSELTIT